MAAKRCGWQRIPLAWPNVVGNVAAAYGGAYARPGAPRHLRRQRPGNVPITNPYDIDRSGAVSPSDRQAARMNLWRWLPLFTAPAAGESPAPAVAKAVVAAAAERPASRSSQVWPAALEAQRTRRAPGEPPAPLWA